MSVLRKLEHINVALKVKVDQFETTVVDINRSLDELHLIQAEVGNLITYIEDAEVSKLESEVPCVHPEHKRVTMIVDDAIVTECYVCGIQLKWELR